MSPSVQAVFASWSFPPWVTALNLFVAVTYLCGWRGLRGLIPGRFAVSRLASFLAGILVLELALASPIDAFDPFLLFDHMLQHMLLMMIVPPLILSGDPVVPLLHGLPRWAARTVLGPFLRWRVIGAAGQWLVYPPVSLLVFSLAMIGWHLTGPYELAVRSPGWHEIEHMSFLVSSLLFWWPVVQPWPSRRRMNSWMLPVYLLLADFVNSALSAFLAFSDRVFYPSYLAMPRLGGISARNDQVAAGAMMWVVGSFAFLIPAAIITVRLLSPRSPPAQRPLRPTRPDSRTASVLLRWVALILALAAVAYGLLAPESIDIDQDVVRMQSVSGRLQITVFTPPDPVAAGELELAALVQDRDTGSVILDCALAIEARPAGRSNQTTSVEQASRQHVVNRLLYAAVINLPTPGDWVLRVVAQQGSNESWVVGTLQVHAATQSQTTEIRTRP